MIPAGIVTVIHVSAKMKKVRNKTRTKQFPSGKPSVEFSASFLELRISQMEKQYNDLAQGYASFVRDGLALSNIHVLDMLRSLAFLYSDIAAHKDALRSLKVDIHGG